MTERAASRPIVRAAAAQDLDRIAAIYAHYVTTTSITFDEVVPATRDWQAKLDVLSGHGLPFLVAEADGDVVGYAYVAEWKAKRAYRFTVESSIYVDHRRTGGGIGTTLLRELIERARAAGLHQLIAVISDTDAAASLAMHERFGFAPVGRLENVGFKFGAWIGVHLLQLGLR